MAIPYSYAGAGVVLEAAEDILADQGIMEALIRDFNKKRGSDAPLGLVADVAVEKCPASLDESFPPQSYPAVRLNVLEGGEEVYGVNNGVGRARHPVEVRVFTTTSDRLSTLDASGKRTLATTATLRSQYQARLAYAALQKLLTNYTVNGVNTGVYNVLAPTGVRTYPQQDDLGFVMVTRLQFDVWQMVRSLRFDFDSLTLIDEYVAPLAPYGYWQLRDFAETNTAANVGTGPSMTWSLGPDPRCDDPIAMGSRGYVPVRNGTAGPTLGGTSPLGNNADRTVEFVITLEDSADGTIFRSYAGDESGLGEIALAAGKLVFLDPTGGSTELVSASSIDLDYNVAIHLSYDLSGSAFEVVIRYQDTDTAQPLTSTTSVGYVNVDASNVSTAWNGVANAHANFNLNHAAIYNSLLTTAHREAVWARAGLE